MTEKRPFRVDMWKVAAFILPLLLVLNVANMSIFHTENIYPVDQGRKHLMNAYETTHIYDKIIYMEKASLMLPKEGNTAGWYPTVATDWGNVQDVMRQTISEGKNLAILSSVDKMAYQQSIPNFNTSIDEIYLRIDMMNDAAGFNPNINQMGYILFFSSIGTLIMMPIMDRVIQDRFYRLATYR